MNSKKSKAFGQKVVDLSTILGPRDPMPSARKLLARVYMHFDDGACVPTLHHASGDFLVWKRTHHERADDESIRSTVWTFLEKSYRLPNKEERKAFKARASLESLIRRAAAGAVPAQHHAGQ
jgi:hypothetical protein